MCSPYRKTFIGEEVIVTDMSKDEYDKQYCRACGSELHEENGSFYCTFCNA